MLNESQKLYWTLDIGNTTAKLAIFIGSERVLYRQVEHQDLHRMLGELETQYSYHARVYANVSHPSLTPLGEDWQVFDPSALPQWRMVYRPAENLGLDRVAAALGAQSILPDSSILIVDCGTCVTYTWLFQKTITGLAIAPGRYMRWKAMHQFTRQLPLIQDAPTLLDEYSTHQNLWIGGHVGWIKEVQGMCEMFLAQHPIKEIIFTGTDALYLKDFLSERSRCLEGLNLIGLNVWLHEK